VRKQYHFWPSDEGLSVWDVDRLIVLSRDLPVREIPVDSIKELDTDYWFSAGSWSPTVRTIVDHMRLVQEVDPSHPVILGPDGRVMDGMHRVALALLEGRPSITAVRFEVLPEPDYRNCLPDDLPYD
jgi:hypothetical protein